MQTVIIQAFRIESNDLLVMSGDESSKGKSVNTEKIVKKIQKVQIKINFVFELIFSNKTSTLTGSGSQRAPSEAC